MDDAEIDLSNTITIDTSSMNMANSTYSVSYGAIPSSYTYSTVAGANGTAGPWLNATTLNAATTAGSGLHVRTDAVFEGDIKWKGRSLGKMIENIEDRLAIIKDPEPQKLAKFAALKKAYDNYKLLEKLCGDDDGS
jgi:hypothetical protein